VLFPWGYYEGRCCCSDACEHVRATQALLEKRAAGMTYSKVATHTTPEPNET